MRKIESLMIQEIKKQLGKPDQFKRVGSNTTVETNKNGMVIVELHGNVIAYIKPITNSIEFHSRGYLWHSRTTFSRLNAIARHFIGESVLWSERCQTKVCCPSGLIRDWEQIDSCDWPITA